MKALLDGGWPFEILVRYSWRAVVQASQSMARVPMSVGDWVCRRMLSKGWWSLTAMMSIQMSWISGRDVVRCLHVGFGKVNASGRISAIFMVEV